MAALPFYRSKFTRIIGEGCHSARNEAPDIPACNCYAARLKKLNPKSGVPKNANRDKDD
jgi:hypothetical protein